MDRALAILGGVVFGLVIGFGGSLLLFDRSPQWIEPLSDAGEESRSQERAIGEGAAPVEPVVAEESSGFTSLAAALDAIPRDSHRRGSGRITGRVVLESGEGLADVVVRASAKKSETNSDQRFGAPPPIKSLEEEVQELVRRRARADALDLEAVTDAQGYYALEGVGDESYRLIAYREGYQLNPSDWRLAYDASADDEVQFYASRRLGVEVSLQLPDGSEPEKATIHVRLDSRNEEKKWSPTNRWVVLSLGDHNLKAVAGEYGEYASDEQRVTIAEDSAAEPLRFELAGRNGIVGKIVRASPDRNNHMFSVRILKFSSEDPPSSARLIRDGRMTHGLTDYSFHDLAPGQYLVGTGRDWNTVDITATVVVGEMIEHVDLHLPRPEESDSHILYAYAPDGTPLTDLQANVAVTFGGGGTHSNQLRLVRRTEGGFWMPLKNHVDGVRARSSGSSGDVSLELQLRSQRYGRETVPVEIDGVREVTVRFREPAMLAVTLTGYVGSGLEGNLTASLESGDSHTTRHFHYGRERPAFDANGKMQLGPVQPGEYRVVLSQLGGEHFGRRSEVSRTDVSLVSGENAVSIDVPPLYSLVVRLASGEETRELHMRKKESNQWGYDRSAEVSEAGVAVFEFLPEGTYYISGSRGMGDQMMVQVPRDRDVEFAPLPPNSIEVRIWDTEGALAKSGFENGDVMVAIEGETFENAMQMQTRFMAAATKKETTVTVDRAGRMIELTVDFKSMSNPNAMGGSVFPTRR